MIGTINFTVNTKCVEVSKQKKCWMFSLNMSPRDSLTAHQWFSAGRRSSLQRKANSWKVWTWTRRRWSLLCFERFQWQKTEPWWLKGRRKERKTLDTFDQFCRNIFHREMLAYQISYSPRCNLSRSPDVAECRSWNLQWDLQTGYRKDARSATQRHLNDLTSKSPLHIRLR